MRLMLPIAVSVIFVLPVQATRNDEDCIGWWQTEFNNAQLENGYCDVYGNWIPGFVSYSTWTDVMPQYTIGGFTWYAQGMMEAQVANRGLDPQHVRGIALESCAEVGETVWLKPPGFDWQGPFIVVDCARREHMYTQVVYMQSVGEIGFQTALDWNLIYYENGELKVNWYRLDNVEVYIGSTPAPSGSPINYRSWWMNNAMFLLRGKAYGLGQIWSLHPDPRE